MRDADRDASLARLDTLARLMDSAVAIPGTNIRLGLDALIGLVPVVGDLISNIISTYIVWEARRLGVSRLTVARLLATRRSIRSSAPFPFWVTLSMWRFAAT